MSARLLFVSVIAAVVLALVTLIPAVERLSSAEPRQINLDTNQAHIALSTANARVALDLSCITSQWQVTGVKALTLNDSVVPLIGAGTVCGNPPRFDVTFADGSTQEYSLTREIVFTPEYRLLILALLGLLALALWIGVRRRFSASLKSRLPERNFGISTLMRDIEAFAASETPLYKIALVIIIGIGIILRLSFVSMPIGLDEAVTFVRYASASLADGLSNYSLPNNHLFHTLLVHISTSLLGIAPWTLRLPAFVAGVWVIPATYAAGRALYNRHAGLLSAAAVAAAWPMIEYSTNGRGYTLICLFFLLLIPLTSYLRKRRNTAGWFLFVLLTAPGFYTIPIMLYPMAIVELWLLLTILVENRGRERWLLLRNLVLATVAAGVLTLILYLPPVLRSGLHAVIANQWVAPLTWSQFTTGMLGFLLGVRDSWVGYFPLLFVRIAVLGFVIGALLYWRAGRQRVPIVAVALLVMAVILTVQRVLPFTRVVLFLLPLSAIIACAGFVWLFGWLPRQPRAALISVCALVLVLWAGSFALKTGAAPPGDVDMEPIARYLETQLRPGDRISIVLVAPNLEYYFRILDYNIDAFNSSPANARRVFIIVNRAAQQSPQYVLRSVGLTLADINSPQRIASFVYFDVYVASSKHLTQTAVSNSYNLRSP